MDTPIRFKPVFGVQLSPSKQWGAKEPMVYPAAGPPGFGSQRHSFNGNRLNPGSNNWGGGAPEEAGCTSVGNLAFQIWDIVTFHLGSGLYTLRDYHMSCKEKV